MTEPVLIKALASLPDERFSAVAPDEELKDSGLAASAWLRDKHAAPQALTAKLAAFEETNLDGTRVPHSHLLLFDHIAGTAACHEIVAVLVPPDGPARELASPTGYETNGDCGDFVSGAAINGVPALVDDDTGTFSTDADSDNLTIWPFLAGGFQKPCELRVIYALSFVASQAFCNDGRLDCALIMRRAEMLSTSRATGADEDALGADALARWLPDRQHAYLRLESLAKADTAPSLPTFGAGGASGYTGLRDSVVFPIDLHDGEPYLARLGHGSLGWRDEPGYDLGVYRLKGDAIEPVAGVNVEAKRSRIVSVTTQ